MRQSSVELMTFLLGLLMGFFLLAIFTSIMKIEEMRDRNPIPEKTEEVEDGSN